MLLISPEVFPRHEVLVLSCDNAVRHFSASLNKVHRSTLFIFPNAVISTVMSVEGKMLLAFPGCLSKNMSSNTVHMYLAKSHTTALCYLLFPFLFTSGTLLASTSYGALLFSQLYHSPYPFGLKTH